MKLQGKRHVHKSVDVSLRKFLQVTLFVLIMSKYLGLLHCKWSGVFLFLCSDSQIRRKPIRKVSAVWLASHGHKRERKEAPSLPPASVQNKNCVSLQCYEGARRLNHITARGRDTETAGRRWDAVPNAHWPGSNQFLPDSKNKGI